MEKETSSSLQKPQIILREYGSNIQKLVAHVCQIEDRQKRTSYAHTLVDLMAQLNPAIRDPQENSQKLWDDLYIMSGFNLDVESPFPMPEKSAIGRRPQHMTYHLAHIRFKHYGQNLELLVKEALAKESPEERKGATIYLGKLMKTFYTTWNKDNVDDEVILKNIEELSKGELTIDLNEVREYNLFDSLLSNPRQSGLPASATQRQGGSHGQNRNNNGGNNSRRQNKNQQNKRRRRN